jgi:hypothetical protein
MTELFWKLDAVAASPAHEAWRRGFALHLRFQPITTIIARYGGITRRYLGLRGCPHCRPEGCDQLCPRTLFAQLVRSTLPGMTLAPVARLAFRASETRHVAAVPSRGEVQPLDAAFLDQWPEGRVVSTWSREQKRPQAALLGARLVVSNQGPDPTKQLREAGWRSATRLLGGRSAPGADVRPPKTLGRVSDQQFAVLSEPLYLFAAPQLTHQDAV